MAMDIPKMKQFLESYIPTRSCHIKKANISPVSKICSLSTRIVFPGSVDRILVAEN
jgi:hypothetical protein